MDRINWVTKDCFNAVSQLARLTGGERLRPDLIHARMRGFLDELGQRAREAGFAERDTGMIAYALVALVDEVVMSKGGALRDFWATQQLQLVYFKENLAGEHFFRHLEKARQAEQLDVLRVYYLCLSFGFKGRYAVRGGDVPLSDLTESVRTQLFRGLSMPEVLAPNGLRPEEGLLDATRRLPVVWISAGLVTLASVLYLGLAFSLREQLDQFVTWMGQVAGT